MEAPIGVFDQTVREKIFLLGGHHVDRPPVAGSRTRLGTGEAHRPFGGSQSFQHPLDEDLVLANAVAVAVEAGEADQGARTYFQRYPGRDGQNSVYENLAAPDRILPEALFAAIDDLGGNQARQPAQHEQRQPPADHRMPPGGADKIRRFSRLFRTSFSSPMSSRS